MEDAINEISKLPGIGRRTATRLVIHCIKQEASKINDLGNALISLVNNIRYCKHCHNISDTDICNICSDKSRNHAIICVVEDISDVLAIENTAQFRGVYHVLGGLISPIDGVKATDIHINSLIEKVAQGHIQEIIMALNATIEGDTTNYYIFKRLRDFNVNITTIARGIAVGDELEYIDEITLGRSIQNRIPYQSVAI